jgi:hypothetical protein
VVLAQLILRGIHHSFLFANPILLIAGPSACTTGITCDIGAGGYLQEGKYTAYDNRNITMIGSWDSGKSYYIRRSVATDLLSLE